MRRHDTLEESDGRNSVFGFEIAAPPCISKTARRVHNALMTDHVRYYGGSRTIFGLSGTELAAAVAKALPSDHRKLGWIFLGLDASVASERMGVNFQSNELKAASGSGHEWLQGPVIVLTPEGSAKDEEAVDLDTTPQVNVAGVPSDTLFLPTVHPTNILPLGDIGGVPI